MQWRYHLGQTSHPSEFEEWALPDTSDICLAAVAGRGIIAPIIKINLINDVARIGHLIFYLLCGDLPTRHILQHVTRLRLHVRSLVEGYLRWSFRVDWLVTLRCNWRIIIWAASLFLLLFLFLQELVYVIVFNSYRGWQRAHMRRLLICLVQCQDLTAFFLL